MADADDLREALALIKEHLPAATAVSLTTSDQSHYGFIWVGVLIDGEWVFPDDTATEQLRDQVDGLINDLNWNGAVGEDKHGNAELSLTRDPLVTFAVEFTATVEVRVPAASVGDLADKYLPKRLHSWGEDEFRAVVGRAEASLRDFKLTDDHVTKIARLPDGDYSTN